MLNTEPKGFRNYLLSKYIKYTSISYPGSKIPIIGQQNKLNTEVSKLNHTKFHTLEL